ncbi:PREDICTED: cyclin-D1-2-like [Lupinus angustifolius]|uniref:cyclin-D1-2-like n=1 Tax=Lupinus angustifolius TaxID=3871 RepID=UPI00092F7596|nr:PREDICTED: cyclin-D1-2-like [Lupinus angustifolius]
MGYIPEFLVPTSMEVDVITRYLEIESSFMPQPTFYSNPANLKIRKLAVSIIAKHWTSENTDAFVPYLAMNYFDRFASTNPDSDAKVPLVAICCLTLASKMRTKSFSLDMIPRGIYDFKNKTIRKMELRILDGLEWQMRPVTPFCFLDHLYPNFIDVGDFKRRCINEIIVQAQGENEFIGHKPSDFAYSCFVAATLIWDRSKFVSIELPDDNSRLHYDLATLCRKKNIMIECAEWKKASSSKTAAARPRGKSDSSSSSSAVVTLQGPSEGPSSSAAVVTLQGPSEGPSSSAAATTETEPDQQRPEGTETSEEVAAADIGTESGQQRPEVAEISEDFAVADTGTVSGQQRLETESEKQRRLDRGKAVAVSEVERDDEDRVDLLAQFFQNMLEMVGTSIEGTIPAAEAAAPRRLMDFDLTWPTDDPFIDESDTPTIRRPTIRRPTRQPLNVEQERMNEEETFCQYLTCGCCNPACCIP